MLEIGLPWRDPVLDGVTIRASMARAIFAGTTPWRYFETVARIRERLPEMPLEVMTYHGVVEGLGLRGFARLCQEASVDAVIVPDADPEQLAGLDGELLPRGVYPLRFAAFDLAPPEAARLAGQARGYVFVQAKPGVTGEAARLEPALRTHLMALRSAGVRVPLAAGFGLSQPAQVHEVCSWGVDGVVVGSATVHALEEGERELDAFLRAMKGATR